VSPLGYILGDEGSGAVLGKILLGDVLKNQLPKHLCEKFLTQYGLDRLSIIRRVYKEPQGNRFMASITPFLIENISEPSIYAIVYNAFKSFFVRNIAQYDGYKSLDVNFIGSIAFYYKDVLEKVAADMGCRIGKILKSPMDGLIQFHTV
jgi:N-acetylglucosamine kinase-like BadF-type ATPase